MICWSVYPPLWSRLKQPVSDGLSRFPQDVFGDSLTFTLVPPEFFFFLTDIHVHLTMNSNNFIDLLALPLAPSSGQNFICPFGLPAKLMISPSAFVFSAD